MKTIYNLIKKIALSLFSFLGLIQYSPAQCLPGEVDVTIDVITDAYGYECYWELVPSGNACGTGTIFAGGNVAVGCTGGCAQTATPGGGYGDNVTVTEGPWCLTIGNTYNIKDVDDWGDGGVDFVVKMSGSPAYNFDGAAVMCSTTFVFAAQGAPPYSLSLDQKYYYGVGDETATEYYTKIPLRQANDDTLIFGGKFSNIGTSDQINVVLGVNVTGAGSFSSSSTPVDTLAGGAIDSVNVAANFTPQQIGTYNIIWNISSDSPDTTATDDTLSASFEVTDTVYARDNGVATNGVWYGSGQRYIVGNVFEIFEQDTATSISMLVGDFVTPAYDPAGDLISFELYDFGVTPPALLAQEFHTIALSEQGTWLTKPLPGVPLPPGVYLAGYQTYTDTFLILVGGQPTPPQTVLIDVNVDGTWGYTDFTPFIRLNVKPSPSCLASPYTSVSATSTVASCGNANGTATANVAGGNPPYNYLWSGTGAQTTATATGLTAGSYTVTINDAFSCDTSATVTVTSTPAVSVNILSSNNPSACAVNDGNATASVSGGTAPFVYSWTPGGQTTATADSLGAGTYTVIVSDSNGCLDTAIVSLSDPGGAVLTISNNTPVSCFGGNNGSATVSASGGTLPLTYLWQPAGGADSTANNLPAGTYTVNVTDSALCQSSIIVNITQPAALSLSPSATGVSCFGDTDGKASVAASGGTPTYNYLWSTTPASTTDSISGLSPGTYYVIVTDANGCVDTATNIIVGEPAVLAVNLSGKTNETVAGLNNGTMSVTASGGTTAYSYNWVPAPGGGQGTSSVTGLSPGPYTVTVTDANGCIDTYTDTILAGPVGITEFKNNLTFNIYPNPTKGQFVVEFSNQKKDDYLVEVKNILGQLVYSEDISNIAGKFTKQINLPGRRGVYFLSITNTSGTRTEKLVVY